MDLEVADRATLIAEVARLTAALDDAESRHRVVHEDLLVRLELLESQASTLELMVEAYTDLYEHAPVPYLALDASGADPRPQPHGHDDAADPAHQPDRPAAAPPRGPGRPPGVPRPHAAGPPVEPAGRLRGPPAGRRRPAAGPADDAAGRGRPGRRPAVPHRGHRPGRAAAGRGRPERQPPAPRAGAGRQRGRALRDERTGRRADGQRALGADPRVRPRGAAHRVRARPLVDRADRPRPPRGARPGARGVPGRRDDDPRGRAAGQARERALVVGPRAGPGGRARSERAGAQGRRGHGRRHGREDPPGRGPRAGPASCRRWRRRCSGSRRTSGASWRPCCTTTSGSGWSRSSCSWRRSTARRCARSRRCSTRRTRRSARSRSS
jgi:hypothetical protein